MQYRPIIIILSIVLLVSLLACASPAASPSPATTGAKSSPTTASVPTSKPASTGAPVSFAGKTITMVVPSTAGSGGDVMARIYGIYLTKYLPGSPGIIVRDMPGGGYTIGANFVYASKPDGLTAMTAPVSVLTNQLIGMNAVKYDLNKMPTLTAVASSTVFYIKPGIVSKVEDLAKAKGITFGYVSGMSSWLFLTIKELIDIQTERLVLSYAGAGDSRRAFLSGELNMSADSGTSYNEYMSPLVKKGEVMALFQTGVIDEKANVVPDPALPPVPTVSDLYQKVYGKPPSGDAWDAYMGLLVGRNYYYLLALPPNTPEGIVKAYQEAVEKMVKDPAFRKQVDPLVGGSAVWIAGETFDKAFKKSFRMDPKVVQWLKTTMASKYGVVVE